MCLSKVLHVLLTLFHAQVGLGTDIAGGYSPSLFNAMRSAVVASKALRMQTIAAHQTAIGDSAAVPPDADAGVLGWREALWLATQGGAEALGLHVSLHMPRPSGLAKLVMPVLLLMHAGQETAAAYRPTHSQHCLHRSCPLHTGAHWQL